MKPIFVVALLLAIPILLGSVAFFILVLTIPPFRTRKRPAEPEIVYPFIARWEEDDWC